jgi:uncharacterized membrane protein YkoI
VKERRCDAALLFAVLHLSVSRQRGAIALIAPPATSVAAPAMTQDAPKKKQSKEERNRASQEAIRNAVQRGELLPLPRILAIAQAKVPGNVIKVELEHEPWGIKYEVKILTPAGRVREVELNARTGAVVRIEDD